MAPTKHLGFRPTRTQEALSHAFQGLLLLPSSTFSELVGVLVSFGSLFIDALADIAPVVGVLGLPGSGADKRLIFEDLCLAAVE